MFKYWNSFKLDSRLNTISDTIIIFFFNNWRYKFVEKVTKIPNEGPKRRPMAHIKRETYSQQRGDIKAEQKIAVATRQGRQPEQKDGIAEIVVLRLIEQIIKGVDQKDQNLNLIC